MVMKSSSALRTAKGPSDDAVRDGMRPTAIDLFAGVGGMSLGAARAGFDVRAAVELDAIAVATHAINFPLCRHLQWDVGTTSGEALLSAAGLSELGLDGLIGGPPCQGFSDIGKRSKTDPRNTMFGHFFRLVDEIRPRFFVAENVPGILAERNGDTVRAALSRIPAEYTVLEATEVAAHRLGAPTTRARVFFVGYDPERMNPLLENVLFGQQAGRLTTVGDALLGLPQIRSDWQSEEQGWRRVERLPTDDVFYRKVVDAVPAGVGSAAAIERLIRFGEVSGNMGTRHTEVVVKRFSKVLPGTTDSVSRAPRLAEGGYCPTLRAGTGSERGSFQAVRPIHHRSPRVITPREAARLQGFPDWFQFHGTKWHSFRQIGNSVSPFVAEALLAAIHGSLD